MTNGGASETNGIPSENNGDALLNCPNCGGGGKLTKEDVRRALFAHSTYASYDGLQLYANGIRTQEIADELNAALDGNECEMVRASNTTETRRCTACGKLTRFDYPLDRHELNYCPKCGTRVRKAVKR